MDAQSNEEREKLAKGDKMLMELNNWVEEYMFDEKTKKYYGEWAEQIAEEKGEKKGSRKKALEIAKNMIDMSMTPEDISKATGLTKEEVIKLKEQ